MNPEDLRAMARSAADFARMARVSQHVLLAKGKTWLAKDGAAAAGELADGYSLASAHLDLLARQVSQEAA